MKNKILALIMVLAMVLSLAPGFAFADSTPVISWTQSDTDTAGVYKLVGHVTSENGVKTIMTAINFDNTVIQPVNKSSYAAVTYENGATSGAVAQSTKNVLSVENDDGDVASFTYKRIAYVSGSRSSAEITTLTTDNVSCAINSNYLEFYFTFASGKSWADVDDSTFTFASLASIDPVTVSIMDANNAKRVYYATGPSTDNDNFTLGADLTLTYTNSTVSSKIVSKALNPVNGEYRTLQAAINAAADYQTANNYSTQISINLIEDVTESITIPENANVTINLYDPDTSTPHHLNGAADNPAVTMLNGSTLTFATPLTSSSINAADGQPAISVNTAKADLKLSRQIVNGDIQFNITEDGHGIIMEDEGTYNGNITISETQPAENGKVSYISGGVFNGSVTSSSELKIITSKSPKFANKPVGVTTIPVYAITDTAAGGYYTVIPGGVAEYDGVPFLSLQLAINAAGSTKDAEITLLADLNDADDSSLQPLTIDAGQNIILDLNGNSISIMSPAKGTTTVTAGTHAVIINKGTLTVTGGGKIRNRGIDWLADPAQSNSLTGSYKSTAYQGIYTASGAVTNIKNAEIEAYHSLYVAGTVNMYGGTVKSNVLNSMSYPGAVYLSGSGSVFNLYKGTIEAGKKSHGVFVQGNAVFNMYGGEVKLETKDSDYASSSNAVYVASGGGQYGSFFMYGGKVSAVRGEAITNTSYTTYAVNGTGKGGIYGGTIEMTDLSGMYASGNYNKVAAVITAGGGSATYPAVIDSTGGDANVTDRDTIVIKADGCAAIINNSWPAGSIISGAKIEVTNAVNGVAAIGKNMTYDSATTAYYNTTAVNNTTIKDTQITVTQKEGYEASGSVGAATGIYGIGFLYLPKTTATTAEFTCNTLTLDNVDVTVTGQNTAAVLADMKANITDSRLTANGTGEAYAVYANNCSTSTSTTASAADILYTINSTGDAEKPMLLKATGSNAVPISLNKTVGENYTTAAIGAADKWNISLSFNGGSIYSDTSTLAKTNIKGTEASYTAETFAGSDHIAIPEGKVMAVLGDHLYGVASEHTVTINNAGHGAVSVEKTNVLSGSTVTLTVTPETDYELDTLRVKDGNGNDIAVTNNSFTMPDSDVTVTATFVQSKQQVVVTLDKDSVNIGETVTATVSVPNNSKGEAINTLQFTLQYDHDLFERVSGFTLDENAANLAIVTQNGDTVAISYNGEHGYPFGDIGTFELRAKKAASGSETQVIATDTEVTLITQAPTDTKPVGDNISYTGNVTITWPEMDVNYTIVEKAEETSASSDFTFTVSPADEYAVNVTYSVGGNEGSHSAESSDGVHFTIPAENLTGPVTISIEAQKFISITFRGSDGAEVAETTLYAAPGVATLYASQEDYRKREALSAPVSLIPNQEANPGYRLDLLGETQQWTDGTNKYQATALGASAIFENDVILTPATVKTWNVSFALSGETGGATLSKTTQTVDNGETATMPAVTVNPGYSWDNTWSPAKDTAITEDTVFTAQISKADLSLTLLDNENVVWKVNDSETVPSTVKGITDLKVEMIFDENDVDIRNVTMNIGDTSHSGTKTVSGYVWEIQAVDVTGNVSVTYESEGVIYIVVSAGDHGTVNPSSLRIVGESYSFKGNEFAVTHDAHYTAVSTIPEEGYEITRSGTYNYSVTFSPSKYTLTVNGTETPEGVTYLDNYSFTPGGAGTMITDVGVTIGGEPYTLNAPVNHEYTIPGTAITGDVKISYTETPVTWETVGSAYGVLQSGKKIVIAKGSFDEDKGLNLANAGEMLWSGKYGGFVYILDQDKTPSALDLSYTNTRVSLAYDGDVNGNGTVTAADTAPINDAKYQRAITYTLDVKGYLEMDVTGNQKVDTQDIRWILTEAVGLDPSGVTDAVQQGT